MRLNAGTILVVLLAIIGLGVIVVAATGLLQWFFDNFWIILLSGGIVFALILWLKRSDNDNQQLP